MVDQPPQTPPPQRRAANGPRGPYKKPHSSARRRVIEAAHNGGNWLGIATANGIPRSTAAGWVQRPSPKNKPRGGAKNIKLTEDHMDQVLEWISDDPFTTLRNLTDQIHVFYGIDVTPQALSRRLSGRFISLKKPHYQPAAMNTPQNKAARAVFASSLQEKLAAGMMPFFFDESNYNLFLRRGQARSPVGSGPRPRSVSKGPNLHMAGLLGYQGLLFFRTKRGSLRSEDADSMMSDALDALQARGLSLAQAVIIFDGAPCHVNLANTILNKGATPLKLGPYSPALNAIEGAWAIIKEPIKAELSRRVNEVVNPPNGDIQKS
ncbi:hypothetical protein FOZ60_006666 [Perkinsus olseni]|uniref:Tc1-like transposase DDE domain-containing protein n=1 Tax=Perkinsus olseni TaxID=32597 RepID=A0A7J6NND2_PEROL|nr:hypothetical protein FOZ60_006666 [Perkinsus olseni]